jgi:hypothetical protein
MMPIKYTYIVNSKALQNFPKVSFVWFENLATSGNPEFGTMKKSIFRNCRDNCFADGVGH